MSYRRLLRPAPKSPKRTSAHAFRRAAAAILLAGLATACGPITTAAPGTTLTTSPPLGRAAIDALHFEPLEFRPRAAEKFTLSNGVTVFFMEDNSLPLVNLYALFRGGSSYFDRSDLAAATALGSSLLLSAGTATIPPDSVDRLIEYYALAPSFSTAGAATMAGMETLTRHLDLALDLWKEMLRAPRLDPERVETWRLRQIESVRRMDDAPGSVAIAEFNHLLFGDHPIGWQLGPDDLRPEHLDEERLRRIHQAIFCTEHLTLGMVGDISREEATQKLEAAFANWPACPGKLTAPPLPEIRRDGGVLIVQKPVNQSSLVMGQPGGILQRDHPEYYAAQVANFILGGSGLSSRLATRVRTEEGLAYSAGTVWGAGTRHERIFGAFAQTRGNATIATANIIREVLENARREPPTPAEVRLAIDYTANGFVFAFENPAQIVTRQMGYSAAGLPENWLELYLAGIQQVTPKAVHEVIRDKIHPADWTFVIVGDTTLFDKPAHTLGARISRDSTASQPDP
jgi:predicted Zn-dependent peptidase